MKPLESEQTLYEAFDIWDLEKGINGGYRILDVGRARRIGSAANNFVVFPVGKASMSYTCVISNE